MKKRFIKMLSIVVALLIAVVQLPISAMAESYPTLHLDAYSGVTGNAKYSFVPEETGYYIFESIGSLDTSISVCDETTLAIASDDDGGENGNFRLTIELEAGRMYIIKLSCFENWNSDTYYVTVKSTVAAESIRIVDKYGVEKNSAWGHVGEKIRYYSEFLPDNSASAAAVWSIEDPSIASVSAYGEVSFKTAGQTTLTVTSENLTASIPVYSNPCLGLTLENSVSLSAPTLGDHACVSFTAAEYGNYSFVGAEGDGISYVVLDSFGREKTAYNSYENTPVYTLHENDTVTVKVSYDVGVAGDISLEAKKIVFANGVSLYHVSETQKNKVTRSNYTFFSGESVEFGYDLLPEGSVYNGSFYYETGDFDIISQNSEGKFSAKTAGTTEIRVYNSIGFSSSATVTVVPKDSLALGGISGGISEEYCGVYVTNLAIEKDGNYKVSIQSPEDFKATLLDNFGNIYDEVIGTSGELKSELFAEDYYKVRIEFLDSYSAHSFTVNLEEYTPLDAAYITDADGNDIDGIYELALGDSLSLGYRLVPEDVQVDDMAFRTNNSKILSVTEDGNITALACGEATVYLYKKDNNNTYDALRIRVREIEDIYVGETKYIDINQYTKMLKFTPYETGYYSFVITDTSGYLNVSGNNLHVSCIECRVISDSEKIFDYQLEQGIEYTISFDGYVEQDYNVTLNAYPNPTALYITDTNGNILTEYTGFMETTKQLQYKLDIDGSFDEGRYFEWSSSDPETVYVYSNGEIELRKVGTAEITVKSYSGFSATVKVTVSAGNPIQLYSPITETFDENTQAVRYTFTPSYSGFYEFIASNDEMSLSVSNSDFELQDALKYYSTNGTRYLVEMTEGQIYYLKAVSDSEYSGHCRFTLIDKELKLDKNITESSPQGCGKNTSYVFVPEESGHYLFTTFAYSASYSWGRGAVVRNLSNEIIARYHIEYTDGVASDASKTYAKLTAGEIYIIEFEKDFEDAITFSAVATKSEGIESMTVKTPPSRLFVYDVDLWAANFNGLELEVKLSTGETSTWSYNNNNNDGTICGYGYSYTQTHYEKEKKMVVELKAGGASCKMEFEIKPTEALLENTPVSISSNAAGYGIINYYSFTPAESGWYLFKATGHNGMSYLDLNIGNSESDFHAYAYTRNDETKLYTHLQAGVKYTVNIDSDFYEASSYSFEVSKTVAISSINIKQYPDKMSVYEGAEGDYDLSGLVLSVTTTDGLVRDWEYTGNDGTVFGFDYSVGYGPVSETELSRYLYWLDICSGNFRVAFEMDVAYCTGIEFITAGQVTLTQNTYDNTYYFPTDKVRIRLNYSDGTSVFAQMHDDINGNMLEYSHNQSEAPWGLGNHSFTVHYGDVQAELPVTVVEAVVPQKITVIEGEELIAHEGMGLGYLNENGEWEWLISDISGLDTLKLEVEFSDGSTFVTALDEAVNGYGIWTECEESQKESPWTVGGENYIVIHCGQASVTYPVTLLENEIESIALNKHTETVVYGDSNFGYYRDGEYILSPYMNEDYEFVVTYKNGSTETVTIENTGMSGYGPTYLGGIISVYTYSSEAAKEGLNRCYLAWGGKVCDFDINVISNGISSIEVVNKPALPANLVYRPDMVGLEIKVNYTSGESENVLFTADNIKYEVFYSMEYTVEANGNTFVVTKSYYDDSYIVSCLNHTATFAFDQNVTSAIQEMRLLNVDFENKTAYVYLRLGTQHGIVSKNLTIDFSNANVIDDPDMGERYVGVYSDKDGVFCYEIRSFENEYGIKTQEIEMLNRYSDLVYRPTYGDLNGDGKINIIDFVKMKKTVAGLYQGEKLYTDYNGDGATNGIDLISFRKSILGMVNLTCVVNDVNGDGYFNYDDVLDIAAYLNGYEAAFTTMADINSDGVIDEDDMNLLKVVYEREIYY